MSVFIDVHEFDGKWNFVPKQNYTRQEKIKEFEHLLELFKIHRINNQYSVCHKGIHLISNNIQLPDNYDSKNKVYADDILMEICMKIKGLQLDSVINKNEIIKDILSLIDEQVSDMYRLGQCSQGRSTRLYQIYLTLE